MGKNFFLRRLVLLVVILFAVSLIIFTVTEVIPGDVATMILGQQATPEDLETLRERLGIHRPAHTRYLDWITGFISGDWGRSLRMEVSIKPLVFQRFRNSMVLALLAFVVGIPTAILLGVVAGANSFKWPDFLISIGTLVAVSVPDFVVGSVLIILFSFRLRWLPALSLVEPGASIWALLKHLVLPTITIVFAMLAHITRMTRNGLVEVMRQDYITTATAKGLKERIIVLRHALPNALLPTISLIAINVGWLIGGLIVVENVFAYPGLGRLLVFAIENRDVPLIQSVTLVIATAYSVANLCADLLYGLLDPRIRYRERGVT